MKEGEVDAADPEPIDGQYLREIPDNSARDTEPVEAAVAYAAVRHCSLRNRRPAGGAQYHAALEQDAALSLHTAQFGIRISSVGDLGYSFAGLNICAMEPPAAMPTPDLRNLRRDVPPVGDVGYIIADESAGRCRCHRM